MAMKKRFLSNIFWKLYANVRVNFGVVGEIVEVSPQEKIILAETEYTSFTY